KIDGAILGALTGGSFHQYHLTYRNEGVIPMNGTVTFTHDPDVTITSNPINASYDSATFTFTWNFSNLVPGQVRNIALTGTLPGTTPTSTPVTTSISVNPVAGDYTPWNNAKTWTDTTAWPYDPNKKQVSPQGIGNPGFIQTTDSVLTYTIRFQNTGNFPANYVIIRDLIDTNLVISSFSAGAFSHPYSVSAEEDQKLVFTFANINLPDSASDPAGSQGFVQFSLKQKPNLPVGTQIKNKASIIFDFNPPIITNEVVNTIFTYPEIQLTEPEDSLCEDDLLWAMISKPAMPPYTYLWQPGEISHQSTAFMDSIPVKLSGLHTVILIDSFGFSDTASVHVPVINYPVSDF
ncbi:MAG: hypothetical protein KDD63_11340, partial [Bacteroidetes bacterium]|nr:hypothetical protein [Bacteroidota bacterium]